MTAKTIIDELLKHTSDFDILAEAFASELLHSLNRELAEEGNTQDIIDEGHFQISPAGREGRRVSNDILGTKNRLNPKDQTMLIQMEVSREGLFESLPARLFNIPEETDAAIRKPTDKKPLHPKTFFLPFEQALYQARIAVSIWERRAFTDFSIPLKRLWGLGDTGSSATSFNIGRYRLEVQESLALHYLLPLSKEICADWRKLEDTVGLLIGAEIEVVEKAPPTHEVPDNLSSRIGDVALGDNMVLGNTFRNGIPGIEIRVKNVEPSEVEAKYILPTDRNKTYFLEEIVPKYFVPMEIECEITISTKSVPEDFTLSQSGYTSILGYTTKI